MAEQVGVDHTSMESDPNNLAASWEAVRATLRQSLGARSFDHWLKPVGLSGFEADSGTMILSVPSGFMASWVQTHQADRLLQAWRAIRTDVRAIRLDASAEVQTVAPTAAEPALVAAPKRAEVTNFDPKLSFDRFVTSPANNVAANAAKAFAAGQSNSFNPLYIHASTGQGKTHLLHAIGQAFIAANPGACVLYMSAERFMFDFVSAVRSRETLAFKRRLRAADLLLIDDVQFIAGKETTQEEFLHTVDELCAARLWGPKPKPWRVSLCP
jgi:chromosomal replication initiator protein